MDIFTYLIIFAGVLLVLALAAYNAFVSARLRIKEAWSQIDVQLKRRSDLIPNLVASVKAYAKHEKGVFEDVTKARNSLMSAEGPADKAKADDMLSASLKSLFAIAEAYPNLKANENFLQVQKELSDTEDKVAYSRQFYNSSVLDYNTKLKTFPNVLIAGNLGFQEEEFYEAGESERRSVKVDFS
ncbi:hypothetical protein A3D03_04530 [Candidatus Gottesmanbacteria bacterium RIFCSPHIGHO2_02_FULL_40_13]|uniref:LemA family protein n=1 Tax=Candidatus Gottesmanbacteria bacterium RIFCSPHIGHO2_02_FULL_40_13 TaxID=1798384 RepID=A0A1F6AA83_9BACT|nr:MAG: hypothetical protein A3D03_04530 [Candidatus Gottesmanbacteria bacterium RIFCSPHIGHO2_02_FULL_40_13]